MWQNVRSMVFVCTRSEGIKRKKKTVELKTFVKIRSNAYTNGNLIKILDELFEEKKKK